MGNDWKWIVIGGLLLIGGVMISVTQINTAQSQTEMSLESTSVLERGCMYDGRKPDNMPETAKIVRDKDKKQVLIKYVIEAKHTDAALTSTFEQTGKQGQTPVYSLNITTQSGEKTTDCSYGLQYEAKITANPLGDFVVSVYHNGNREGNITYSGSDFDAAITAETPSKNRTAST